jgi:DNA-binding NtrC family response regulator
LIAPRETLSPDRRRILLVDDDVTLLSQLTTFLVHAGAWDVWQAPTGKRAIAIWSDRRELIDVVVADVRLPDISGEDLVVKFFAEKPTLHCLLISGIVSQSELGVCVLLQKPFTQDELIQTIQKL